MIKGFPCGSDGKESSCNAGEPGSIPWSGRSPREGNGNPLQYSCLENSMDRAPWWVTIDGVRRLRHIWATNTITVNEPILVLYYSLNATLFKKSGTSIIKKKKRIPLVFPSFALGFHPEFHVVFSYCVSLAFSGLWPSLRHSSFTTLFCWKHRALHYWHNYQENISACFFPSSEVLAAFGLLALWRNTCRLCIFLRRAVLILHKHFHFATSPSEGSFLIAA